jgi:predicted SnoaL-like aldol condensation-catalyzing enzyme
VVLPGLKIILPFYFTQKHTVMKNLLLLAIAVSSICISCNNSGGMSATAKKNMEVNDAIMKAYEAGDFSKMGDYIAADAVDHGGEKGDVKGLDSIVAEMKRYHTMMPDMKATMTRSLADDEYVFTRSTTTGTMGGKQTSMTSVDVSKFKDGKAVEHWIFMDPNEMMKMMQSMPQPAMDTTSKK